MATKSDFSEEQWRVLRDAPHLVVISMAAAGASGIIGSLKEAFAPAGTMVAALKGNNNLLKDVCNKDEMKAAVDALRGEIQSPDLDTVRAYFRSSAITRVGEAIAILKEKGDMADCKAYADFLMELADKVAKAEMEGGSFFGFGGVRVSEPEKALLADLEAAIAGTAEAPVSAAEAEAVPEEIPAESGESSGG